MGKSKPGAELAARQVRSLPSCLLRLRRHRALARHISTRACVCPPRPRPARVRPSSCAAHWTDCCHRSRAGPPVRLHAHAASSPRTGSIACANIARVCPRPSCTSGRPSSRLRSTLWTTAGLRPAHDRIRADRISTRRANHGQPRAHGDVLWRFLQDADAEPLDENEVGGAMEMDVGEVLAPAVAGILDARGLQQPSQEQVAPRRSQSASPTRSWAALDAHGDDELAAVVGTAHTKRSLSLPAVPSADPGLGERAAPCSRPHPSERALSLRGGARREDYATVVPELSPGV